MATALMATGRLLQARFDAAVALHRAVDTMVLLERCEVATGRPFVTEADRVQVKDAVRSWRRLRWLA